VRELSHVIERAVLWSRGSTLEAEHLSLVTPADQGPESSNPSASSVGSSLPPPPPPTGMPLDQWERTLIEQALKDEQGNQTRAAQRLGITRDTLRYRLKKHGIQG
jgi:DNA-binding NtrC family response regulator